MILIGAAMAWLLAHQIARPVRRLARECPAAPVPCEMVGACRIYNQ